MSERLETYYDIDGIALLTSIYSMENHCNNLDEILLEINIKTKFSPRILNKNKTIFNKASKKSLTSIFISELITIVGRFNIFLLFDNDDMQMEYLVEELKALESFSYCSYLTDNDSGLYVKTISMRMMINAMKSIKEKYGIETFLYGEKYGSKFILNDKAKLKSFLNKKFTILKNHLYRFDYFEIDICKNIRKRIPSDNKYFTNIKLRRFPTTNKNYYAKFSKATIYEYNIMNNTLYTDYHTNDLNIKLSSSGDMFLTKLNMYNPLMNFLCNKTFEKAELYSKKFIHEALYKCGNIKFYGNYKHASKFQRGNIEHLLDNVKSFHNFKHFYRCEYKFFFDNKLRKYSSFANEDIKNIYKFFYIYNKRKYVEIKVYKISNFIKRFKSTISYMNKEFNSLESNFTSLSKKIFLNIIFYEYFRKGGNQLHFLNFDNDFQSLIKKDQSLKTIYLNCINKFKNLNFCLTVIYNYINKSNIKRDIKANYLEIIKMTIEMNSRGWKYKIFDMFIEEMAKNFQIDRNVCFNVCENAKHEIIDTIKLTDFVSNFFTKFIISEKIFFRGLYYKNIIFALKILREKYPIDSLDIEDYIKKKKINYFKIAVAREEEVVKFYKFDFENLPTVFEYKKHVMRTVSNIIRSENILRQKKDGFLFTNTIKKLYCYFRDQKEFSNLDFTDSTLTPLWLLFIYRTRVQNLKKQLNKMTIDWRREPIPDILVNTKDKCMDFIHEALIFKERINIYDNKEFKEIIFFLIDTSSDSYSFNRNEYIRINNCLRKLRFSGIEQIDIINKRIQVKSENELTSS